MKSIRLTYSLRRRIVNAAVAAVIPESTALELRTQLYEEAKAFAADVNALQAAPSSGRQVCVNCYGDGGDCVSLYMANPNRDKYNFNITNHALMLRMTALYALETEEYSRRMNAENTLCNLLDSVSTTKQLLEVWPDGITYVEAIVPMIRENAVADTRKAKASAVAKLFDAAGFDTLTAILPDTPDETIAVSVGQFPINPVA